MCGCGCELGLALAICRAEEAQRLAASKAVPTSVPCAGSVFERLVVSWLACMFGDTPMQRLSRGSGQ
jgi:hypothetical protein